MIYFLLAVFLGPFSLLNLVLAVVSASYEMEVNDTSDPDEERNAIEQMKRTTNEPKKKEKAPKEEIDYTIKPTLNENSTISERIRYFSFLVVDSSIFEGIIIGCITINTAFMASEHYGMDENYKIFLEYCNYVSAVQESFYFSS